MIEFVDLEILFNCCKNINKLKNKLPSDLVPLIELPLSHLLEALQCLIIAYEKGDLKNE